MLVETSCLFAIPANSAALESGNHRIRLNRSEVQQAGLVCRRPTVSLDEKPECRFESYHGQFGVNMNEVKFYSTRGQYGCFSNFSGHPIKLKGHTWPTTEHYFQAQKFAGTKFETLVRKCKGPKQAALIGRNRRHPLRKDWESIKDDVMYDAIKAKFTQHKNAQEVLLSTGDANIVENTTTDYYWGCGKSGTGKNRLGILLMRLRDELRLLTK